MELSDSDVRAYGMIESLGYHSAEGNLQYLEKWKPPFDATSWLHDELDVA